ncbi:MAG: hypothetical protein ACM3UO_00370 [Bacillota bacterium]
MIHLYDGCSLSPHDMPNTTPERAGRFAEDNGPNCIYYTDENTARDEFIFDPAAWPKLQIPFADYGPFIAIPGDVEVIAPSSMYVLPFSEFEEMKRYIERLKERCTRWKLRTVAARESLNDERASVKALADENAALRKQILELTKERNDLAHERDLYSGKFNTTAQERDRARAKLKEISDIMQESPRRSLSDRLASKRFVALDDFEKSTMRVAPPHQITIYLHPDTLADLLSEPDIHRRMQSTEHVSPIYSFMGSAIERDVTQARNVVGFVWQPTADGASARTRFLSLD